MDTSIFDGFYVQLLLLCFLIFYFAICQCIELYKEIDWGVIFLSLFFNRTKHIVIRFFVCMKTILCSVIHLFSSTSSSIQQFINGILCQTKGTSTKMILRQYICKFILCFASHCKRMKRNNIIHIQNCNSKIFNR